MLLISTPPVSMVSVVVSPKDGVESREGIVVGDVGSSCCSDDAEVVGREVPVCSDPREDCKG